MELLHSASTWPQDNPALYCFLSKKKAQVVLRKDLLFLSTLFSTLPLFYLQISAELMLLMGSFLLKMTEPFF